MTRQQASVLKARRQERQAMERAMVRALRNMFFSNAVDNGEMPRSLQVELIGLERARRRL